MKLYIEFDNHEEVFQLPKGISKANIEQSFRNEFSTNNLFLEIIENGTSYFINKHKIVKLCVEDDENENN